MNVLSSLAPTAYAAVNATAFGNALNPIITNVINPLVELMFAIALVAFVYGVIQMIIHREDSEGQGRSSMIGGIIGMFIMLSAWGIINLVANTVKQF